MCNIKTLTEAIVRSDVHFTTSKFGDACFGKTNKKVVLFL